MAINDYFTELEIWYLIFILLQVYIHFKKNKETIKLQIENVIISDDGRVKVIPDVLTEIKQIDTEVFNLSNSINI